MNKPKEFWVYKGTSNFYGELVLDDACENYIRNTPDGFYDIVSEKDTIEGAIRVIEYSAYKQLKAENEQLEDKVYHATRLVEQLRLENEELSKNLEVAKKALSKICSYFDCLQCENSADLICSHHLENRMEYAIQALKEIGE